MSDVIGNREGVPVVALDIDNTLGNYHRHFLAFAELWLGRPMPDPEDINPGLRLWQFMGVTTEEYRQCKLAFRQGGLKRWMPVYEGAADLTREIRAAGADVWICTTRPFARLDNIDPDTREWMRRNGIAYDALLFGEDKYHELVRQTHGHRPVIGVFDDLPEMVDVALELGLPTFIRTQPYNLHYQKAPHVGSCADILKEVKQTLDWLERGPFHGIGRGPQVHRGDIDPGARLPDGRVGQGIPAAPRPWSERGIRWALPQGPQAQDDPLGRGFGHQMAGGPAHDSL